MSDRTNRKRSNGTRNTIMKAKIETERKSEKNNENIHDGDAVDEYIPRR